MLAIAKRISLLPIFAALLIALVSPAPSHAEEKRIVSTTITVGEMCSGCVKQITAHLNQVKEVAKFKCDIKTKTVVLFPAKDIRFSPKKLWESMESIGKTPKKLVGPDGSFTAKPKK